MVAGYQKGQNQKGQGSGSHCFFTISLLEKIFKTLVINKFND